MKSQPTILIIENEPEEAEKFIHFTEKNGVESLVTRAYDFEPLPPMPGIHGVIVTGGEQYVREMDNPKHAYLRDQSSFVSEMVSRDVPVLGVCLGHQLLAHALGGKVRPARNPEFAWQTVTLLDAAQDDPLFEGIEREFMVFQYHYDEVVELPPGATRLAFSETVPIQAFRFRDKFSWGIQCHPEWPPDAVEVILRNNRKELEGRGIDVDRMVALGYQGYGATSEMMFANFINVVRSI